MTRPSHHHEAWQLLLSAKGGAYCGACGAAVPDPPRNAHKYWADVCTCGLGEQERTGHYPEHADWCDVPSPLDDDDPPPRRHGETLSGRVIWP